MEVSGQLHTSSALSSRKEPRRYPLDKRLCGPQNRSGRVGEEKNSHRWLNGRRPARGHSLYWSGRLVIFTHFMNMTSIKVGYFSKTYRQTPGLNKGLCSFTWNENLSVRHRDYAPQTMTHTAAIRSTNRPRGYGCLISQTPYLSL